MHGSTIPFYDADVQGHGVSHRFTLIINKLRYLLSIETGKVSCLQSLKTRKNASMHIKQNKVLSLLTKCQNNRNQNSVVVDYRQPDQNSYSKIK